ncbi:hypothetical protein SETIT_6G195400v2 [Setaria italica]|uniref:Uncharacterized protein n=1 Tax=Setaria italica TaxID=4555 RepID=A0A368RNG0_SETIT|nr:hypothetical protein SETIT_6G195400v2 [Setaria italica]
MRGKKGTDRGQNARGFAEPQHPSRQSGALAVRGIEGQSKRTQLSFLAHESFGTSTRLWLAVVDLHGSMIPLALDTPSATSMN